MNLTTDQLQKMGYLLQPDGSYSKPTYEKNPSHPARLHNPKPKPAARPALDKARQGKAESKVRTICRITRCATRLLDADNFAGGCKPLVDQLRYAKLIPDDDPESIELQFAQMKTSREAIRTEIEIWEESIK
jgi:hypothetical protein